GQGAFRVLVTDAYNRQCAVSGEKILPALEATHIKPYSKEGPNDVKNGILLRADIHKLFDAGYITITYGILR
ncbi:MAG TPA: HNH endonuclease signature motif containing protein, partial [Clostridia bacterium]